MTDIKKHIIRLVQRHLQGFQDYIAMENIVFNDSLKTWLKTFTSFVSKLIL